MKLILSLLKTAYKLSIASFAMYKQEASRFNFISPTPAIRNVEMSYFGGYNKLSALKKLFKVKH